MPSDRRVETAPSRTFSRRPMIATEAPCFPNWVAISNPIPDPPPVNRATFPLSTWPLKGESSIFTWISNQTKIQSLQFRLFS